jgi:hypothetical protein
VVHELDEADRVCCECGNPLCEWQGQDEDSEEIDLVVRSFSCASSTIRGRPAGS